MFSKLLEIHENTNFGYTCATHTKVMQIVDKYCPYDTYWTNGGYRSNSNRTREERMRLGAAMHDNFAAYFESGNPMVCGIIANKIMTDSGTNFDIEELMVEYLSANEWSHLKANCKLVDNERRITGMPNQLLYDTNGHLVIIDWKFGQNIIKLNKDEIKQEIKGVNNMKDYPRSSEFWRVALKLNLYRVMLEKSYDLKVSTMVFMCFDENFNDNETIIPRLKLVNRWYDDQLCDYVGA